MTPTNVIKNGEISVFADTALFSKNAIFKCLYWYGDKFHTSITLFDQLTYCIKIKPVDSSIKNDEMPFYLQKLERDLIDFQLRDTITQETKNVRDILLAKAFSNGEFDEDPPGEISDPIGFHPTLIDK